MLAITIEQEQLAEAVTQFAARHAPPIDKTRAALDSIAAGGNCPRGGRNSPPAASMRCTFEDAGGQGGTLADMACVIERPRLRYCPVLC